MPKNLSAISAVVSVVGIAAVAATAFFGVQRIRSVADLETQRLVDRTAHLGEIRAFAASQVPPDWMPCDGRALDRDVYRQLYGAIGTRFGSPDAGHFSIPDLRHAGLQQPAGAPPLVFAIYVGSDDGLEHEAGAAQ
jgi:hypothetical protein